MVIPQTKCEKKMKFLGEKGTLTPMVKLHREKLRQEGENLIPKPNLDDPVERLVQSVL